MGHQEGLVRAREFVTRQNGQMAPLSVSEEELNPEPMDDASVQAYPLESMKQVYRVDYEYPDDSACSNFKFFEDGRQRTIQIGHIPCEQGEHVLLVPVHYFVVGAAILQRDDKRLTVWQDPLIQQGIFVAKSLVPNQTVLNEFERSGYLVIDTDIPGKGTGDYIEMRRRALRKAKDHRLRVEQELITRWRRSDDAQGAFLVVDGTLMNMRDEANVDRCLGISKSFTVRFFDVSDHSRILRMKEFERSWAFAFHDVEADQRMGVRERVSWYLKLREHKHSDPEFGLIRVEISKKYKKDPTHHVDQFSKSLLSERLPTSYPKPRWDKQLYPIRECENYLSSVMPSTLTITASMRG